MRELESIIKAYDQAGSQDLDCVLATVVHVEGSSYRQAGARMLVDENGRMTGAISGGCLEGDALRKALHALHQGQNKLITYDTSDEDDAVIGAQLGCNGVIQVLFEPIDPKKSDNPIEHLKKVVDSNEQLVIVTLFNLNKTQKQNGTLMVLNEQRASGSLPNPELTNQIKKDARMVFAQQHSYFGKYMVNGVPQYAFLEHHSPPPNLVLVGAGNDAQILASMADLLGWNIVVADGRPSHANPARFISSCQVIVTKPDLILENIEINERTIFVLISHNYNYDLAVLKLLLHRPEIPYIGILGPKKKYDRMLEELHQNEMELSPENMKRIFAPVGLHIGAETPAEIALSILAEIQKILTGTNGRSLREKEGAIHERHSEFKVTTVG